MSEATDLGVMTRQSVRVTVGGREIALRAMTIVEIPDFLAIAAPLLQEGWSEPLQMLQQHRAEFIETLAYASGTKAHWLCEQNGGEVVRLARVFWELNEDFFVEALGPTLAALARLAVRARQTGLMSFSGSSDTATGATTS